MVSKIDERIIRILQTDARTPIAQIAREVGFSENGVRYRMERLENEGYIRNFAVLLNPKKFGMKVTAIFNMSFEPKLFRESLPKLLKIDEFVTVYQTTGRYNVKAHGLFKDNEELERFVNEKLLINLPISEYNFEIVTKKLKDSDYEL